MRIVSLAVMLLTAICLVSCSGDTVYAPVIDVATIEQVPQNGVYRVKEGDTLYSIAWRYGLDYRYLAKRNNITAPYHIRNGQVIYLRGRSLERHTVAVRQQVAGSEPIAATEPSKTVKLWQWPARGAVARLNKGINISGHYGAPIVATAAGRVVYSGNGLRMYGELIIIKHNNLYLSAYAYNSKLLVKEGEVVRAGQKIAEMGYAARRRPMLHFEIRRGGQPVNPLSYLSKE